MIEFLFGVATSLTASAIDRQLGRILTFSEKQKVQAKISEIAIAVVEPLSLFLKKEGVPEQSVQEMGEVASEYVEWLVANPDFSFSRGLDGEKITRDLIFEKTGAQTLGAVSEYPAAFETIVRAFVDLVTKTPSVFEAWEKTSFQTIFRKIEDIKSTLSAVYDAIQSTPQFNTLGDGNFEKIVGLRATTLALKTSIHGLRQSPIPQAELDNLFVFPRIFLEFPELSEGERIEVSLDIHNSEFDEEAFEVEEISDEYIDDFSEFLSVLNEKRYIILQGPAGSGKTTLSSWISARFLQNEERLFPIVLPLRKTVKSNTLPTLTEMFTEAASPAFRDTITSERVKHWANEGRIVVVFEGFDEVGEGQRDDVLNWIEGIRAAHENIPAIITTRPLSTQHVERFSNLGWGPAVLAPFDIGRVTKYIEQFQKHGPSLQTGAKAQDAASLARAWQADPTLSPLTGNPLLLSTLLVVHHMDGELPDDRSSLYERYIDGMLGLWEVTKDLSDPSVHMTKDQKKKILEIIAINMISLEVDAVSEEDVCTWIGQYLIRERIESAPEEVLSHLRERSGLLVGPGQYTFAHKSIGEFLVARACNDGIQTNFYEIRFDRFLLSKNCKKDRWLTVAFLWSGIAPKAEVQSFISSLLQDGSRELAIGLLLERRKSLGIEWFEDIFWECVRSSIRLDEAEAVGAFFVSKAPIAKFSLADDRISLSNISSISHINEHEADLVYRSFEERLVRPDDWEARDVRFVPQMWYPFLRFASLTPGLLHAAPEEYSIESKKYIIIKEAIRRTTQESFSLSSVYWLSSIGDDGFGVKELVAIYMIELFIDHKLSVRSGDDGIAFYHRAMERGISEFLSSESFELLEEANIVNFSGDFFRCLDDTYVGSRYGVINQIGKKKRGIVEVDSPRRLEEVVREMMGVKSSVEGIEKIESIIGRILAEKESKFRGGEI